MALNYSTVMRHNPHNPNGPKKAYGQSQMNQELSLKDLSKRVASQTTVSRADVSAVLISAVENLIGALREGMQVDFGDLGKFCLQICSKGAESAEKFTSANITNVRIQFKPGEELRDVFNGMEFNQVPTRAAARALLKAQKAGEKTVDITTNPKPGDAKPGDTQPAEKPDAGKPDAGKTEPGKPDPDTGGGGKDPLGD